MGKRKKTQEKWEMTKIGNSKGNKSKWTKNMLKFTTNKRKTNLLSKNYFLHSFK